MIQEILAEGVWWWEQEMVHDRGDPTGQSLSFRLAEPDTWILWGPQSEQSHQDWFTLTKLIYKPDLNFYLQ